MSETLTSMFPQKHQDQMDAAAAAFDWRCPPRTLTKVRTDHLALDASEGAFLARQLEFMRPGLLEVQYPELKGSRLVPIDTSIDPGAEWFTYQGMDYVGTAEVGGGYANSQPRSDVKMIDGTQKIQPVKGNYAYTFQENRNAMYARVALPARKAMACRDIIERALDNILFVGNTAAGLKGLLTLTGTTVYTPPIGSGGSKLWSLKTTDEVIADMTGIANAIVTGTNEVEQPDTLLLPLSLDTTTNTRRVGDGTSMNVQEYFLKNSRYIKTIENTYKAETQGSGSTTRTTAYKKDPNKLVCPMLPFEQLAPQAAGYEIITYCHARSAGVVPFFPKSLAYADSM